MLLPMAIELCVNLDQNKGSNLLPSDVRSFLWKCWCDNNVLLQLAVHYSVGFHLCGFHYLILRFLFVYFQFFQFYLQGGMNLKMTLAHFSANSPFDALFYSFQHHPMVEVLDVWLGCTKAIKIGVKTQQFSASLQLLSSVITNWVFSNCMH